MPHLTEIAVFVRIAACGSFTRAAEELQLSRAVVSKYLSQLEKRLGARLIHRTTRRLSLTEAGAALFGASRGAIERIEEAEEEIAGLQEVPRGRLKLAAPMGFGILYLGEAVAQFMQKFPEVSLDVHFDDRFVNLIEGGFDVAIRIGLFRDSSLVARKLAVTWPIVCASPRYLAERGEPETPEDLASHDCQMYSYLSTADVWRFKAPDGRELPVAVSGRLRVNNGVVQREAAIAGLGVLMAPDFYVAQPIREKRLKRILSGYTLPELGIYAMYPQREYVPPKVRAFVDFLVARYRGRCEWQT